MRGGVYDHVESERARTTTTTTLSLGARMRKGLRNFCQGDSSTSTRNNPLLHHQQTLFLFNNRSSPVDHRRKLLHRDDASGDEDDEEEDQTSFYNSSIGQTRHCPPSPAAAAGAPTPTLEEMIKQLELEEEMAAVAARRAAAINLGNTRRASCANTSSDRVLRSARNALNQYPPRFSLDGKDSMYRSSFLSNDDERRRLSSACCCDVADRRSRRLENLVSVNPAGRNVYRYDQRNVVWCRPGVVPKLMGLDAIPVPRAKFFPKAPVLFRKRRYGSGGGDDDDGVRIDRVIRPSGNR